jgi:hypothetical protein
MSAIEYRFLRFEIVGIATVIFLVVGVLPILDPASLRSWISDPSTVIALLGGLFLISLPLGYAEHQVVVNVYRSHKTPRAVFEVLEDMVLNAQDSVKSSEKPFFAKFDNVRKNSFLTSLLDVIIYSQKNTDPAVYDRLSGHWSHFYARRAVGKYAPLFSIFLWLSFVVLGFLLSWPIVFRLTNFVIAVAWFGAVLGLCVLFIDSYAKKIWFEISFLETSIVLANRKETEPSVLKVVSAMIEHPEYIERGDGYGAAIWRL